MVKVTKVKRFYMNRKSFSLIMGGVALLACELENGCKYKLLQIQSQCNSFEDLDSVLVTLTTAFVDHEILLYELFLHGFPFLSSNKLHNDHCG